MSFNPKVLYGKSISDIHIDEDAEVVILKFFEGGTLVIPEVCQFYWEDPLGTGTYHTNSAFKAKLARRNYKKTHKEYRITTIAIESHINEIWVDGRVFPERYSTHEILIGTDLTSEMIEIKTSSLDLKYYPDIIPDFKSSKPQRFTL